MMVCSEIQRRIDEADDIKSYDLQVARHTETCEACRRFAHERAALRELIGSTVRVNAPVNFDAMLHARLAEVKGRKGLGWLNAAMYLRAGAATAAVAITVFVAQQMGFFAPTAIDPGGASNPTTTADAGKPNDTSQPSAGGNLTTPATADTRNATVDHHHRSPAVIVAMGANTGGRSRGMVAGGRRGVPLMAPVDAAFVDGGAILIPGRNGQHDVTVPTVSVGAQPLIYGNASRQPQASRTVTVSF